MKKSFLFSIVIFFAFAGILPAEAKFNFKSNALAVDRLGQDFVFDNKEFRGSWVTQKRWGGLLCDGGYQYRLNLYGLTHQLDFEIVDDNSILGVAELRDVYGGVKGRYLSDLSGCLPLKGWLGVSADNVRIRVKVTLGGANPEDIKIRVLETKFGTIHLGELFPDWFEELATDLLNDALVEIWPSQLGEWLSAQVTKVLKDKLPTH